MAIKTKEAKPQGDLEAEIAKLTREIEDRQLKRLALRLQLDAEPEKHD